MSDGTRSALTLGIGIVLGLNFVLSLPPKVPVLYRLLLLLLPLKRVWLDVGFRLTPLRIMLGMMAVPVIWAMARKPRHQVYFEDVMVATMGCVAVLGYLVQPSESSLRGLLTLTGCLLSYLYTRVFSWRISTEEWGSLASSCLTVWSVAAVTEYLLAVAGVATAIRPASITEGVLRAVGPVGGANDFAAYVLVWWILSMLSPDKFVMTLGLLALTLTYSRSAIASLLVYFLYSSLERGHGFPRLLRGILVSLTVAAVVATALVLPSDSGANIGRFSIESVRASVSRRAEMVEEAFNVLMHEPWLGTGVGAGAYLDVMSEIGFSSSIPGHVVHNSFLEALVELGLVGGSFYLFVFLVSIARLSRSRSKASFIMSAGVLSAAALSMGLTLLYSEHVYVLLAIAASHRPRWKGPTQ